MHTWGVAALLLVVTWIVLAGVPGAPVSNRAGKALLAAGFLVIGIGFYLLSIGPVDSVESMTWAPLALVAGFCVIVPVSLLWSVAAPGRATHEEASSDSTAKENRA